MKQVFLARSYDLDVTLCFTGVTLDRYMCIYIYISQLTSLFVFYVNINQESG